MSDIVIKILFEKINKLKAKIENMKRHNDLRNNDISELQRKFRELETRVYELENPEGDDFYFCSHLSCKLAFIFRVG
jgi:chromosome segregation ATPase